MKNLEDLEKFINSELTSSINSSYIKHDNIYLNINHEELINVITFLKSNKESLKWEKLSRLKYDVHYSQLYKAICKNLKTKQFPG